MARNNIPLFLLCFSVLVVSACETRSSSTSSTPQRFSPYLEDPKHVQIPQWEHEDWYVEDWTSQAPAQDIINGFYRADILKGQKMNGKNGLLVLIVGPNFYHLSGLDKRRVITLVDYTHNLSGNGAGYFFVQDWYTGKMIGEFNGEGLRLH